jgi:hypothetical protein
MQTPSRQNRFRVSYILLALLASLAGAKAANVSLAWNQSPDTNTVGYNIYYGTVSGNYTNKVAIGNVSAITISNLTAGTTYYFVATAFDANGNQSVYSNEATIIVPGVLGLSQGANPGDPMMINFPVEAGHWYEVQASVDLKTWTTIYQTSVQTTNDVAQFSDPNSSAFSSRFYRLALH